MRRVDVRGFTVFATLFMGGNVTFAFAQGAKDAQATQLLDVDLSVTGAYDTDVTQEEIGGLGQLQPAGYSTWGTGSLIYLRRFTGTELQASASSAVRYVPDLREVRSVSHAGDVSLSAGLPKRFSLNLQQSIAYSPSYLYGLFPTLPAASDDEPIAVSSDPNYDVDSTSSYNSTTSMSLERRMSRRTRITIDGNFTHTGFSNESGALLPSDSVDQPVLFVNQPDLTLYSIGGRFSRNVSRNTQMSTGYRYRTGEFGYARGVTTGEHSIDFGVEHTRQLSATRRLDISLRSGASTVEIPESTLDIPETVTPFDIDGRQYHFNVEASVAYPIAESTQVRGSYTRGLEFVAGLTRPLFVDGISGDFNTVVLGRIELHVRVGRSTGQSIVFEARDNLLETYTGEVRISYLISRQLTAFVEGLYYAYDTGGELVDPIIPVAPGIPPDLDRRGIRVGLLWRVPVLRR